MFDLIRSIAAGFGGKLRNSPEARKLVWLLIVALFFSGCCIFFIAYVSFTRYRAVAGFLPGADVVAMSFTVGIALFMYYTSSHFTSFDPFPLWAALALCNVYEAVVGKGKRIALITDQL